MHGISEIRDNAWTLRYDNQLNPRPGYDLSVVVPNYNRKDLFRNLLRSLMDQRCDFDRIELVVVDDGGEAAEIAILRELAPPFRIRYFWQPHLGRRVGRIRNLGIKLALGEIVLFLDSDALASPRLIAIHLKLHDRRKRLAVLGNVLDLRKGEPAVFRRYFGQDAPNEDPVRFIYHWLKREWLLPWIYRWNGSAKGLCFCTLHASAKREDLLRVDGFDEEFDGRWGDEDLELGYRLEKNGVKVCWSGSALVYHQWHPVGLNENIQDNRIKLMLKYPETIRHRKIGGLINPFRSCTPEALASLDRWEDQQAKAASRSAKTSDDVRILFARDPHPEIPVELSLIVCTCNRESFFPMFIESLRRQTVDLRKVEVIFADDGGGDRSLSKVKEGGLSCKLKYVWQEKRGFRVASSRNNGIRLATAEIVVFTDIDAILDRRFLEAHLAGHQGASSRILVGIGYYLPKKTVVPRPVLEQGDLFQYPSARFRLKCRVERMRWDYLRFLAARNAYATGTFVSTFNCSVRKNKLESESGFDPEFDGTYGDEDIDLFCRLVKSGVEVIFVPQALAFHRWHPYDKRKAVTEDNRWYLLMKHPEMLGHRIINVKVNHHYKKSVAEIRCFRLWAKRMTWLNEVRGESVGRREFVDRGKGIYRILIPALWHWFRQARKLAGRRNTA